MVAERQGYINVSGRQPDELEHIRADRWKQRIPSAMFAHPALRTRRTIGLRVQRLPAPHCPCSRGWRLPSGSRPARNALIFHRPAHAQQPLHLRRSHRSQIASRALCCVAIRPDMVGITFSRRHWVASSCTSRVAAACKSGTGAVAHRRCPRSCSIATSVIRMRPPVEWPS